MKNQPIYILGFVAILLLAGTVYYLKQSQPVLFPAQSAKPVDEEAEIRYPVAATEAHDKTPANPIPNAEKTPLSAVDGSDESMMQQLDSLVGIERLKSLFNFKD